MQHTFVPNFFHAAIFNLLSYFVTLEALNAERMAVLAHVAEAVRPLTQSASHEINTPKVNQTKF